MKFIDAVREMVNGKTVRRESWTRDSGWHLDGKTLLDNKGKVLDDWEVVSDKERTLEDKIKKIKEIIQS